MGPLSCTGILHSAPFFRANNTAEPRGYFSTFFFIYISIKRILICMFVVCPEEEGLMQNSFAWTKDGRKPLPTGRVLSAHREQSCQEQRMPSAIQVPLKGLKPFLGL